MPEQYTYSSRAKRVGEPFRVLIVDDESLIRELLSAIFESTEHYVEIYSGARPAIEALKLRRFDLVVTDITMPDVSDDMVVAAAQSINPRLPVVVMTGHPAEVTNKRVYELGADEVLLKPFSVEDLKSLVDRHHTARESGTDGVQT